MPNGIVFHGLWNEMKEYGKSHSRNATRLHAVSSILPVMAEAGAGYSEYELELKSSRTAASTIVCSLHCNNGASIRAYEK